MDSAQRIFELIKERKVTAKEVARVTGLAQSNFTEWKKGRSKPGYGAVAKLAEYFNVSTDYLLGRTNERSPKETADYSGLTKSQKRMIETYNEFKTSDDPFLKKLANSIDQILGLDEYEDD